MQKNKIRKSKQILKQTRRRVATTLATLGLTGLVAGCSEANISIGSAANAQTLPSPTPTSTPSPIPPTPASTWTLSPTNTPWPTATRWPTPTPWPTPRAWVPEPIALPTLAPVPIVPTPTISVLQGGITPVGYSPPNGVDVFGNTILRWIYSGSLAEDEFFDIKIKPLGSENSAFVDWSKSNEYELRPWHGWTPGLYTWQIGIVKGHLAGETKHFITDTDRDSEKFIIKWQAVGGHDGGGNNGGGGGGSGNNSGGS